jgi:hypothetical protein
MPDYGNIADPKNLAKLLLAFLFQARGANPAGLICIAVYSVFRSEPESQISSAKFFLLCQPGHVVPHFYLLWPWAVRRLGVRFLYFVIALLLIAAPVFRALAFARPLPDGFGDFLAAQPRCAGYSRNALPATGRGAGGGDRSSYISRWFYEERFLKSQRRPVKLAR